MNYGNYSPMTDFPLGTGSCISIPPQMSMNLPTERRATQAAAHSKMGDSFIIFCKNWLVVADPISLDMLAFLE